MTTYEKEVAHRDTVSLKWLSPWGSGAGDFGEGD